MKPVEEILSGHLHRTHDVFEIDGTMFYCRNWNVHRCVLVADSERSRSLSPEMTRDIVYKHQRSGWFTPMAFGVVLGVDSLERHREDYRHHIDVRSRGPGTWQWAILHSVVDRQCVGYHTWTPGRLTPAFQDILRYFHDSGFAVEDQKVPKGPFLSFLQKVGDRLSPTSLLFRVLGIGTNDDAGEYRPIYPK